MAYTSIPLDAAVHPFIEMFVRKQVEPVLRDVRMMLGYPKAANDPGFNFTAATSLCNVLGGLSRVFYSGIITDGESFKAIATYYARIDPASAVPDAAAFANDLYKVYRCTLVHGLGLVLQPVGGRWKVVDLALVRKVVKSHGMTEADIDEIEQLGAWPMKCPPTMSMSKRSGAQLLCVEGLYCGIRRLVKALAEDASLAADATAMLSDWASFVPKKPAPSTLYSGTSPAISATATSAASLAYPGPLPGDKGPTP